MLKDMGNKAWFHGVPCSILSCICLNVCKMSVWPDQHLSWIQSVTLLNIYQLILCTGVKWFTWNHKWASVHTSSVVCMCAKDGFLQLSEDLSSSPWRSVILSVSVCFYDVSQLMSFQPPFFNPLWSELLRRCWLEVFSCCLRFFLNKKRRHALLCGVFAEFCLVCDCIWMFCMINWLNR